MSMSISLKKATNKTNIKHNNRTMSEKEKEENQHIDESRSYKNNYLVQKDLKELYQEEFGGALEKYNAKQKRKDRKIDDYYKHIQSSKKTALQQEMILQVGDLNDFTTEGNYQKANEVLLDWFEKFEERNPNLKVYNAAIHNDEASPHLHVNFVPVAGEYKRGLEKQVSFDRAIIQQDSTLDKTRPFDDWREKEVNLLEKLLAERGIERKLVGTNEYKDVNDYKEKKDLEKEIQLLEKNIVSKKEELLSFTEEVPNEINVSVKKQMRKIEVKSEEKNIFGIAKKEYKREPTGNVIVSEVDFKKTMSAASDNERLKNSLKNLLGTDLVQENKELNRQVDSLFNSLKESRKENQNLITENKELKSDIRGFKDRIEALTIEVNSAYQGIKEFVKGHAESARSFRSAFKNVVDIVKAKSRKQRDASGFHSPYGEFERTYNKEQARERNRGMER